MENPVLYHVGTTHNTYIMLKLQESLLPPAHGVEDEGIEHCNLHEVDDYLPGPLHGFSGRIVWLDHLQ